MRPPRTRKDLIDLYKIAVDEYRFEVRLNWDRMQYFAVVNSGIIAVAATLVRDARSTAILTLSGLVFLVGAGLSVIGVIVIHRGRDYYQDTILKKTVYEHLMGLNAPLPGFGNSKATLAIGTTQGMRDAEEILRGRPAVSFWRRLTRNRIQTYFIWLLFLLGVIDAGGVAYTTWRVATFVPEPAIASAPQAPATPPPAQSQRLPTTPPIQLQRSRPRPTPPQTHPVRSPTSTP